MKFQIEKNQIRMLEGPHFVTTGNVNSLQCHFVFDSGYNDLDTFAVFYRDDNLNRLVELDSSGACTIPWELLQTIGYLYIGACGVKSTETEVEKRTTTNAVMLRVENSLSSEVSPDAAPEPDLWEAYRAEILGIKSDVQSLKNQAQTIKDSTEIFYDVQTNKVGFRRADESSFTYTGDLTGPQGPVGPQGLQGLQGPKGDPGETMDAYFKAESDSRYANAITGETSGTLVTLSDAWVGGVLSKCKLSDSTAQLVYITGKNLLDPSLLKGNGTADLALQDDGTIILNGTDSSKNTTFYHPDHPIYLPAGEYRISLNTVSGSYSSPDDVIYFGMRKTDGSTVLSNQLTNSVSSKSFRFVSTGLYYYFYIVGKFVCTDWRISIQIEPGTVTTPYEQYVGAEYATNALNSITVPKTEAIVRADAGEVSVTYTKDTNKVIAALTEQISTLKGVAQA